MNRLARHGEEYQLNESFKKVALKKILVGKILDNFEILNLDKLPFEQILVRVKELARIKKLEKDVAQGRTGVATGSQRPKGPGDGHQHQYQVPSFGAQEEEPTDVNAFNGKGPGWGQQSKGKSKGKGKGKDQKGGKSKGKGKGGKAQQTQSVNAAGASPGFSGCFHCGGQHYLRDCPSKPQQANAAGLDPCPAGAVVPLCTLTVREDVPGSKSPGSSSAPELGEKGTSTHNMFSALSEEERKEGPPPLTDSESEEDKLPAELDSDSEEWLEGMSRWLEEASCRNNRWSRWRKVVAK